MFESPLYRVTSLIRNSPPPLGPPYSTRHSPTVGSQGGAVSYERGTPVTGREAVPVAILGAVFPHSGGITSCRMTRVTVHSHVRYKEI